MDIDYDTCTNCDSGLTEERRNLISLAIANSDTVILRDTVAHLKTPMTSYDRLKLNGLLANEVRKGIDCDDDRVKPLADKGATLDLSTIQIYGDQMVFCNGGLTLAAVPYYLIYQSDKPDALLAYLMAMRRAVTEAMPEWYRSNLAVLDGTDHSDLPANRPAMRSLRSYAQLVRTVKDLNELADVYMSRDTTQRASEMRTAFSAMADQLARAGAYLKPRRDALVRRDPRIKLYDHVIKLLPELFRDIHSYYEKKPGATI